MARPKSPILTEGELRIMKILWQVGPVSVREVADALAAEHDLAYTTVLSTLQTLEKKGVVAVDRQARAHTYRPLLQQQEARRGALRYILSRFFDGSADSLALNLLEDDEVEGDTVERLRRALADHEGNEDDGR